MKEVEIVSLKWKKMLRVLAARIRRAGGYYEPSFFPLALLLLIYDNSSRLPTFYFFENTQPVTTTTLDPASSKVGRATTKTNSSFYITCVYIPC